MESGNGLARKAVRCAPFWLVCGLTWSMTNEIVRGAIIGIGDFSGNETLVDFEDVPTMGTIPIPLVYSGVRIYNLGQSPGTWGRDSDTSHAFGHIPGASLHLGLGDQTALTHIQLDFRFQSEAIQRVGLLIYSRSNSLQVGPTIFDVIAEKHDGTAFETFSVTESEHRGQFVGIETSWAIKYLDIKERPGQNSLRGTASVFDDVRFEALPAIAAVPEPSAILLWCGTVAAGIGRSVRGRRTKLLKRCREERTHFGLIG